MIWYDYVHSYGKVRKPIYVERQAFARRLILPFIRPGFWRFRCVLIRPIVDQGFVLLVHIQENIQFLEPCCLFSQFRFSGKGSRSRVNELSCLHGSECYGACGDATAMYVHKKKTVYSIAE